MGDKCKVLIIHSSALVRQRMTEILAADPALEVMGAVIDPRFAGERMRKLWPSVIVLELDGGVEAIGFLGKLLAERRIPVVVAVGLTEIGTEQAMKALSLGAIGVITIPASNLKQFFAEAAVGLVDAVRTAAGAGVWRSRKAAAVPSPLPMVRPKHTADVILAAADGSVGATQARIVVIGISAGGTRALERILPALPKTIPGIAIVQHMPERFTASLALRLDGLCEIEVREAQHGDRIREGLALIAPGGRHMLVKYDADGYFVEVVDGPLVNRHKPSVDVLFRSAARYAGKNALGIIMTGMGDDGAIGLLEMRAMGAATVAQDEASCAVYGMPREAVRRGAVGRVLPLDQIPKAIVEA